jgi:hypothetical protein
MKVLSSASVSESTALRCTGVDERIHSCYEFRASNGHSRIRQPQRCTTLHRPVRVSGVSVVGLRRLGRPSLTRRAAGSKTWCQGISKNLPSHRTVGSVSIGSRPMADSGSIPIPKANCMAAVRRHCVRSIGPAPKPKFDVGDRLRKE